VPGLAVAGGGLALLVIPLGNVVLAAVPAEAVGGAVHAPEAQLAGASAPAIAITISASASAAIIARMSCSWTSGCPRWMAWSTPTASSARAAAPSAASSSRRRSTWTGTCAALTAGASGLLLKETHIARIHSTLRLRDQVQTVVLAYQTGVASPGSGNWRPHLRGRRQAAGGSLWVSVRCCYIAIEK
jgi:hypothetical protein